MYVTSQQEVTVISIHTELIVLKTFPDENCGAYRVAQKEGVEFNHLLL
jgi:hypothetical protein